MTKYKTYGFKTPVRRQTKNITGHKVGGDLTGGECKIGFCKKFVKDKDIVYTGELHIGNTIKLFKRSSFVVFAMGGYFYPNKDIILILKIAFQDNEKSQKFILKGNSFSKVGLDLEILSTENNNSGVCVFSFKFMLNKKVEINYTHTSYGIIDYEYFKNNDVYTVYFNSKRNICIPEQFYFKDTLIFNDSTKGIPFLQKSCNRCQRFLPINLFNEREQLAFSNHCSTKAPCKHSTFSNYKLTETEISKEDIKSLLSKSTYKYSTDTITSFYGHQLECKACKKFFVNSPLNPLRTSTQHREDSLRRRAFELLIGHLLEKEWIYHTTRVADDIEFDIGIWEKFNRRCFKCKKSIKNPNEMDLDHTLPLVFLYPLDKSATCLCSECNSDKSDKFPVDFYSEEELKKLSKLTEIDLIKLKTKEPNEIVIKELKKQIEWFFEDFLTFDEYTKVRDGKKASDSILHSLQKIINNSSNPFNLIQHYEKVKKINQ